MISRLFQRKPAIAAPATPTVPSGTVVWAVGDVHGRLDLLDELLCAIRADLAASPATRKLVIFLGDYIDRGADSRGVLLRLAALANEPGVEWRFLLGNHEQTMLDFLSSGKVGAQWCEYGGVETLASYGLKPPDMRHRMDAWDHLSADLAHKVTPAELDFLNHLELQISVGDYFFCHAGARPGVALEQQSTEDLLWIRKTFLDSEVQFDKVVVHGHTPTKEVYLDRRRIGVDTKAYSSGILSALRLEGAEQRVVQAGRAHGRLI